MRFKPASAALAAILAASSSPVLADPGDWSSDRYDVAALDTSCSMNSTFSFDGRADVELSVHYTAEADGIAVFLTSWSWNPVDGQKYDDFSYIFSDPDDGYGGGKATGYVDGLRKGFMTGLPATALNSFAQARRFTVVRRASETDEPTIVADINLIGSGAAVAALRRCATTVANRNAEQARREARFDYIARDPFAAPEAPEPAPGVKPDVSWSREPTPDFPERASERGVTTGSVELLCTSQSHGAPTNCSVVSESPSGAGFGQAALRSMRSARFSPATVDAGGSHRFTVSFGSEAVKDRTASTTTTIIGPR